jgi:hypothetical protein
MSFMRIFTIFETIAAPKKTISSESTSSGAATVERGQPTATTWSQTDRRTGSDRRQQERRTVNCQPYIDTRKNNGRRRSFGRRLNDQVTALPF